MDGSRTSQQGSHFFDLLTQPFRILGIDPTATSRRVEDGFEIARQNQVAADGVLSSARNAILDPLRRLTCELTYPLDGPAAEIPALFAALADAHSTTSELIVVANRLAPLARANFVAHIAARRPANSDLLYTLIESHAVMDPMRIYEILKAFRTAAGIPAPALLNVNHGLDELLHLHVGAAFAGFATIDQAAEPVLTCIQRILEHPGDYYMAALVRLLEPYRALSKAQQSTRAHRIEVAAQALRKHPTDIELLEKIKSALHEWASLCRPLMLVDVDQAPEFQIPANLVRLSIADLATREHYDVALQVAHVAVDVFGLIPASLEELHLDIERVRGLWLQCNVKSFKDLIGRLESEPAALVAALAADGFGATSTEPAKTLWEMFLQVLKVADEIEPTEPWRLVRNLAMRMGRDRGSPASTQSVLAGLIRHGETVKVAPEILEALRQDLSSVTPVRGAEPMFVNGSGNRRIRAIATGVASLAVAAALGGLLYYGFHTLPKSSVHPLSSSPAEIAAPTIYAESMPAVGTGQRLALPGVRYCHYQEERLRIIQRQARSPEDVRAFNLLAVDYNARCSDFFYQDVDVNRVMAEIAERRQQLDADARRMMATWPGHEHDADGGRANPR